MSYLWLVDQVDQHIFSVQWALEDFKIWVTTKKQFNPAQHNNVQPYYLHLQNYPIVSPKAQDLRILRRCAKPPLGYE